MKKLLVASTALVLVAGAAVAEVKVTGNARMGLVHNSYKLNGNEVKNGAGVSADGWDFNSRFRVVFTASGETDGGLSFGGTIRADNSSNGANGSAGNVWISGAFGKLSMGDVDSASEAANGNLLRTFPGFIDDEWDHVGYIGAGASSNNPVALYEYTFGSTTVYASLADGTLDTGANILATSNSTPSARAKAESYGIGVKHVFGDFTVAAGYESSTSDNAVRTDKEQTEEISVSAAAVFGDIYVKAIYQDGSYNVPGTIGDGDWSSIGLGVEYTMGQAKLIGYYNVNEGEEVVGGGVADTKYSTETYGIGASYNLGGGASVLGGISRAKGTSDPAGPVKTTGEQTRAQIGLNFTF